MLIKDMFKKKIDREIQGVIVVGEEGLQDEKNELEEYVVTRELQKHFAEFFANYKKGLVGKTRKNGVWISGFFGSGKSHFLKMLAYLLGNKLVEKKPTIDYFKEDNKVQDTMVMADMDLAVNTPTDVILFNIDSKSEQTSKQHKDAIVSVFLKVFNEMQGFYGSKPYIADLERNLTEDGQYEAFQGAFLSITGHEWKEYRHRFSYERMNVAKALVDIGYHNLTMDAANDLCKEALGEYNISIENFARMVKAYLDKKGNNHHLVFCVDEVGQYIGSDSQMMLNLQTIREELGKECEGRAWVIVTSQQDIDSIITKEGNDNYETKGNDFSKIQGRFDTRLSLSSANVDEVIKKRILAKTDVAAQTLRLLYKEQATNIKTKLNFEQTAEMKLYANAEDFAEVYPFVPYQFNLLGKVLNSIRTHGASGKHLSEGERSMLALFKKSAVRLMNENDGVLAPFYMFYDALDNFLDAVHSRVISQALDNKRINPNGEKDCFAVNVLKALFMVKYVKEFQHTSIDNITRLMVSHVDEDIYALTERVKKALDVLENETLIQKHNGNYVFLTEEEQEIGREIERQTVEIGEILNSVSKFIYDDIYPESRYKYGKFSGRYTFAFNQLVDDRLHKANQSHKIGVHVITPYYGDFDEHTIYAMSNQGNQVIVVLPNDVAFLNEIRTAMKIEKYIQHNPIDKNDRYKAIKESKIREMKERNANARTYLVEALRNADIYVNGSKSDIKSKDISSRINEALGKLVDLVYNKLRYIDSAMDSKNIEGMLETHAQGVLNLGNGAKPNVLALQELEKFIGLKTKGYGKVSLKAIKDQFMDAPYGYIDDDVEWMVARLFKDGDISLSYNSQIINLINKTAKDIANFLTKKGFVDNLFIEPKQKLDPQKLGKIKGLFKTLFGSSTTATDEDALMAEFKKEANRTVAVMRNLETNMYNKVPEYPGRDVVKDGITLFDSFVNLDNQKKFFDAIIENEDELEEFADEYGPVKEFFSADNEQKEIFDKALGKLKIYEDSENYITNEEIKAVVQQVRAIVKMKSPYGSIRKLPVLLDQFDNIYLEILDENTAPITAVIDNNKNQVMDALNNKPYKDKYYVTFLKKFTDLKEKVETTNNIMVLRSYGDQSDAVKVNLFKQMEILDEEWAQIHKPPVTPPIVTPGGGSTVIHPVPPIKKKKRIDAYFKHVTHTSSWMIESEADIDKYLGQLREQLKKVLTEDTIINIKF